MKLHTANTHEIPLLLRKLPTDREDPALHRARRYLELQRRGGVVGRELVLEVLSALRDGRDGQGQYGSAGD